VTHHGSKAYKGKGPEKEKAGEKNEGTKIKPKKKVSKASYYITTLGLRTG